MTKELTFINLRQYPYYNTVKLTAQKNKDGDYPDGDVDLIIDADTDIMIITLNENQAKRLKDWL
jgi:hypothetical protein